MSRTSLLTSCGHKRSFTACQDTEGKDAAYMKRERNKELAKFTREKKKEEVRSLEDQIDKLERQNKALQCELSAVQEPMMAFSPSITSSPSFDSPLTLTMSFESNFTTQVTASVRKLQMMSGSDSTAFFVINATSYFFPIICASPALVALTGYDMHELIGQNCGFLCGPQTSRIEREKLNNALQMGEDIASTMLNYRRNGKSFWNHLQLMNIHAGGGAGGIEEEARPFIIVGLHTEVCGKSPMGSPTAVRAAVRANTPAIAAALGGVGGKPLMTADSILGAGKGAGGTDTNKSIGRNLIAGTSGTAAAGTNRERDMKPAEELREEEDDDMAVIQSVLSKLPRSTSLLSINTDVSGRTSSASSTASTTWNTGCTNACGSSIRYEKDTRDARLPDHHLHHLNHQHLRQQPQQDDQEWSAPCAPSPYYPYHGPAPATYHWTHIKNSFRSVVHDHHDTVHAMEAAYGARQDASSSSYMSTQNAPPQPHQCHYQQQPILPPSWAPSMAHNKVHSREAAAGSACAKGMVPAYLGHHSAYASPIPSHVLRADCTARLNDHYDEEKGAGTTSNGCMHNNATTTTGSSNSRRHSLVTREVSLDSCKDSQQPLLGTDGTAFRQHSARVPSSLFFAHSSRPPGQSSASAYASCRTGTKNVRFTPTVVTAPDGMVDAGPFPQQQERFASPTDCFLLPYSQSQNSSPDDTGGPATTANERTTATAAHGGVHGADTGVQGAAQGGGNGGAHAGGNGGVQGGEGFVEGRDVDDDLEEEELCPLWVSSAGASASASAGSDMDDTVPMFAAEEAGQDKENQCDYDYDYDYDNEYGSSEGPRELLPAPLPPPPPTPPRRQHKSLPRTNAANAAVFTTVSRG